jgi:hypothetical protein
MADADAETLKHRLTILEAELQQAKERVRAFEDWRKGLGRTCTIVASGIAAFLFLLIQIVPASGSGPSTVKAPFTIVSASGKKLVQITDGRGGAVVSFYNNSGASVGAIGSNDDGDGGVVMSSGDQKQAVGLQTSANGPALHIRVEPTTIVALGEGGIPGVSVGLTLNSQKGAAAQLLVSNQKGKLNLADADANIRVEAGIEENDNGAVEVAGPTGKCPGSLVGVPCMIVGH